ncbi:hypothetical protein FVF58_33175 [Paraburkholderia panacisoli]|uniref:Uncharacterized protein n=1 Tax=Paraburkholderia panacisoli TaxID=2603818 RepID=A0A5B0GLH7_9BURK|nr:hypothetical protein [Paraburkholderia panacisoli]KAA1004216.1 hypothetical protein FVF58_33175 [Paraburkholderia panacisoli]
MSRIVSALWLALPATACSYGDTPARRVLFLCAASSNAGCLAELPLKRIVQAISNNSTNWRCIATPRANQTWQIKLGRIEEESPRMQRTAIDTAVRATWPVQGAFRYQTSLAHGAGGSHGSCRFIIDLLQLSTIRWFKYDEYRQGIDNRPARG